MLAIFNLAGTSGPDVGDLTSVCAHPSFSTTRSLPHYSLRDSLMIPPAPSVSCPPPLLHRASSATPQPLLLRRATTQTSAPSRSSRSHNARPFARRRSKPHPEPIRRRLPR